MLKTKKLFVLIGLAFLFSNAQAVEGPVKPSNDLWNLVVKQLKEKEAFQRCKEEILYLRDYKEAIESQIQSYEDYQKHRDLLLAVSDDFSQWKSACSQRFGDKKIYQILRR